MNMNIAVLPVDRPVSNLGGAIGVSRNYIGRGDVMHISAEYWTTVPGVGLVRGVSPVLLYPRKDYEAICKQGWTTLTQFAQYQLEESWGDLRAKVAQATLGE